MPNNKLTRVELSAIEGAVYRGTLKALERHDQNKTRKDADALSRRLEAQLVVSRRKLNQYFKEKESTDESLTDNPGP